MNPEDLTKYSGERIVKPTVFSPKLEAETGNWTKAPASQQRSDPIAKRPKDGASQSAATQ